MQIVELILGSLIKHLGAKLAAISKLNFNFFSQIENRLTYHDFIGKHANIFFNWP